MKFSNLQPSKPKLPIRGKLLLALNCLLSTASSISEHKVNLERRPIVTGCLDACGYKDTQCVTECQVCVEHHSCSHVNKCKVCEKQVLSTRRAALRADVRAVDSGGKSLIHEGLRVKYLNARIALQDAQRHLLLTRDDVITAQTTATYSAQERSEKAKALQAARQKKVGAQKTVHRWSKKNAARLERAKRRLREAEQEALKKKKELKAAKAELQEAHARVKEAKEEEADEKDIQKAEKEEWKAQMRVEEESQKVEKLQEAVHKRKKEAKWVDKHLRQQVEGKQDDIEVAAENLEVASVQEKQSLKTLQNAREAYKMQIKRSEAAEERVDRLEKELEEHPLPGKKSPPERKPAFRSVAFCSAVGLLPLLSLWMVL